MEGQHVRCRWLPRVPATQSGGPYEKLNSDPVRETRYKDTEVQAGHTYFYAVTAVDSKGHESVFAGQVQAVVPSK